MTLTTRTEYGYSYRGGEPYRYTTPNGESTLEAVQNYIARSPEFGNVPADFQIVTRDVTTDTGDWMDVDAPTPDARDAALDAIQAAWSVSSEDGTALRRIRAILETTGR